MRVNKKVRLAILGSRGIPARYGGYETVVESISTGLAKMGVDVTVFSPTTNEFKGYVYNGVRLNFVQNLERRLGSVGTLLYDLISLIKSAFLNFDVIYMLGYSSAIFCIIPRIFGKKVVINTDGMEWKRSKWSKFARLYLKRNEIISTKFANVLISDSLEIRKYFIAKYHISPVYISYGTELFYSKNKNIVKKFDLEPFNYYLVVARLEPENNIDAIIRGFSLTKSKKRLVLITNIKKTKYYYQIKRLCEKDSRIRFLGPLYDKNSLNEIRANAFAYIHGHSVGGTNPSLLESMGCGNFIIAFDVSFNREVLRNGGYFFSDEYELKKCMEDLEKMKSSKISKIGIKNRKTIERYYNWRNISLSYFNLFKKLVKS